MSSCGFNQPPFEIPPQQSTPGAGEANTASNVGGEVEVFKIKSGVDLQFRTLKAGDGVTLTQNANDILIESTGSGKGWDAEEVKTSDQGITYSGGTNSDWVDVTDLDMTLETDTLYEFEFHLLGSADNDVYSAVSVAYSGTSNVGSWSHYDRSGNTHNHTINDTTLTNKNLPVGYSEELLTVVKGQVKTTSAGTLKVQVQWLDTPGGNFYIADDSFLKVRKVNTFTNFQPSVGEANTGVNLGSGSGLYASKSGVALQFKSLVAGTGITLNSSATEIEIVASGGGGLTYWTESEYTHVGKTGTKWTPDTVNTDQDVVLQPKGEGAIIAQQPDGSALGGNNRGRSAVDLQMVRSGNTEVVSGYASFSVGGYNTVSSNWATGIGLSHTVTAPYGFSAGRANNISGDTSFSIGSNNTVAGSQAGAFGRYNYAPSYGEFAVGVYNTNYTASGALTVVGTDRAFVIGNGTGTGSRSNALVVYKSGAVEINEAYTLPTADGTIGQVIKNNGDGTSSWQDESGGGGGGSTTLSNLGAGVQLVNAISGGNYPIKTLVGTGGTTVTTDGTTVTINSSGGSANTLTNVGGGNELVKAISGSNYPIRTIIAGSGITVTENTNDITISASGGGSLTYWTESEFTETTVDYAKFTPTTGTNKGVALHFKGTGNVEIGADTNSTEGTVNVNIGNSNTINSNASNSHIVGAGNLISDGQYNAIFGGINHSFATTGDYNTGLGGEDNDLTGSTHHAITAGGHSNGMTGASHYSGMFANNDCTIIDSFQSGIAFSETSTINTGADRSVIIAGHNTSITAGRTGAVAIGQDNTNSGNNSFTAGKGLLARSFGEMVVGAWNTDYTANSTSAHNTGDRAFTVGIGSGSGARKNGLVVKKSGAVEINEAYELPTADGNAGEVVVTDGAGNTSFGVANNIVLIAEETVSGSAVANVTFSSLTLTDYYKVDIVIDAIATTDGSERTLQLQLNGETGGHYDSIIASGGTALGATGIGSNKDYTSVGLVNNSAEGIDEACLINISLIEPGKSSYKKRFHSEYFKYHSDRFGKVYGKLGSGTVAEDPITSILLQVSTGNIAVGSNIKLIGYRHQS